MKAATKIASLPNGAEIEDKYPQFKGKMGKDLVSLVEKGEASYEDVETFLMARQVRKYQAS